MLEIKKATVEDLNEIMDLIQLVHAQMENHKWYVIDDQKYYEFYLKEGNGIGYKAVDSIKMYGGDSSQLTGSIINSLTQVNDGVNESIGIDLKSAIMGILGAKVLGNDGVTVIVGVDPQISTQLTD